MNSSGFRILITAGPTREPIDPVRFLTNASSGEMGIAIADVAASQGARVTLIYGPTSLEVSSRVKIIPVVTAREMHREVMRRVGRSDFFIATAAVSDFRPARVFPHKLKKNSARALTIRLVRNPDILAEVGAMKKRRKKGLWLVGFALETERIQQAARKKLREKNLDLIIGNTPSSFGSSRVQPYWLEKGRSGKQMPQMTKRRLASKIVEWAKRVTHV